MAFRAPTQHLLQKRQLSSENDDDCVDAKYSHHGLQLKGNLYMQLSTTPKPTILSLKCSTNKGIGSAMLGYYIEFGYNVFQLTKIEESELIPFIRYEKYDTQQKTDIVTLKNDLYNNTLLVTGLDGK